MGKYNGVLVQIMDVYSAMGDTNYRRQKVCKSNCFAKAVLTSACDATNEADKQ